MAKETKTKTNAETINLADDEVQAKAMLDDAKA